MNPTTPHLRRARWLLLAGLCVAAVSACGSSAGLATTPSAAGAMSAMRTVATTTTSGMSMNAHTPARLLKVDGITPIPTQVLATDDWQDMKISAMAMTAVPFYIFDGSRERAVKVPRHVSFHLMVNLDDARTNVAIPYASVWASITRNGKLVYDERQWPMLSEYLGPHYGNNVKLPGPGHYRLSLLISPPVAARHVEYRNVWLKAHRVTASFDWNPPKS